MGLAAVLIVVAVMLTGLNAEESESDLVLTTDPAIITDNVTETFSVDCRPGSSLLVEGNIGLMMDIFRDDGTGNAFVARQRIKTTADENERLAAEGHMKTIGDDTPTHLTVSFENPSFTEEGLYTCRYVYMDATFQIHHASASINVTVEVLPPPTLPVIIELPEATEEPEMTSTCMCDQIWDEIKSLKETLVLENRLLKEEVQKYNESCRVSFSARLSKDASLFNDVTTAFDDVVSNKGGAFNAEKSVFVAPCEAQYFFSLTLRSQQKMDSGYVDGLILVDGEEVARTSVFIAEPVNNYQSATNGAVVTLSQGQEVSVKVKTTSAGKLKSSTYSVFSGFYLYP